MRIVRFGPKGNEKPGLLVQDRIVDLRKHDPKIPDIDASFFADGWLERIAKIDDPGEERNERFSHPVRQPSKIICLGKNYAEHAREGGFDVPQRPLLFSKAPTTLNGPNDPIILPVSSGMIPGFWQTSFWHPWSL